MIQQMDLSCLFWIQSVFHAEWMDPFWRMITALGNIGWFWILLAVILLIYPGTRRAGMAMAAALLLQALVINLLLKPLAARTRPYEAAGEVILLIKRQMDYSFPSGHSGASFAGALVCVRMLPKKLGIAALLLAGMISFSRLYLGVHYPLDVFGGIIVGTIAGWFAVDLIKRNDRDGVKK